MTPTASGATVAANVERRELILATASALFAAKGIAATTVRDIADEVGLLSGSLYRYFESKDAIVAEILDRYLEQICDRYERALDDTVVDPARRLHRLIVASLQVAEDQPHASTIYQNEVNYLRRQESVEMVRLRTQTIQDTWLNVIESGIEQGVFRSDVSAPVFMRMIRDAVWLASRWYRTDEPLRAETLSADVARVFLGGMLTAGGPDDAQFRQPAPTRRPGTRRTRREARTDA